MQNLPLTEERIVALLKEVQTPAPQQDLIAKLAAAQQPARRWRLGVSMTIAATAAALLLASVALRPRLSYAEVVQNLAQQTRYTITDTSLFNHSEKRVASTDYRDGSLWRYGTTYGLKDRTVTVCLPRMAAEAPSAKYVLVDDPQAPPEQEFRPEKLLWPVGKPSAQRNVTWEGRTVDIFTVNGPLALDDPSIVKQELIVDPRTRLPIRLTRTQHDGEFGDIYDFDFTRPNPAVFEPQLPAGAQVYDLRVQRKQILDAFAGGAGAVMLIGEDRFAVLLLSTARDSGRAASAELSIVGHAGTFSGNSAVMIQNRLHPEQNFRVMRVGDKLITPFMFSPSSFHSNRDLEKLTSTFEGSIQLNKKNIELRSVPVIRTGGALDLMMSLSN